MTDKANPTWLAVDAVRDWLAAAGLRVHEHPTLDVSSKEREMACALIEEEAAEFRAAVEASDLVEIADCGSHLGRAGGRHHLRHPNRGRLRRGSALEPDEDRDW